MNIVVIDYGIGNIQSIKNAFEEFEVKVILSKTKEDILNADGVILPGVGAFSHGMNNLIKYNLVNIIHEYVKTNKPILGICLGMQMMLEESEEFGITKGLGLIKGKVIKIPVDKTKKVKLPHISWNGIKARNVNWKNTILENVPEHSDMYFVHTYVANPDDENEILSVTEYAGVEFCSSIKKNNIYGCQFHPEKSSKKGLSIINNFIKIARKI
jgi:glutamine amidotransferase